MSRWSKFPNDGMNMSTMKKTTVKKITLSRETLLSLQENELRAGGGSGVDCTGPSCEIFRACTIAGWDC